MDLPDGGMKSTVMGAEDSHLIPSQGLDYVLSTPVTRDKWITRLLLNKVW